MPIDPVSLVITVISVVANLSTIVEAVQSFLSKR
jgi:hypothetical protein